MTGQLAQPFETLLGEELRQYVARRTEADLVDAVEDVFRTADDDTPPEQELALAGATPATVHAAQGLKEKTTVGAEGQLSNPPEVVESLAEQGSQASHRSRSPADRTPNRASKGSSGAVPKEKGRLSNPGRRPVQRRLSSSELDKLVAGYEDGRSLREIAAVLGIHHRTVAAHLERLGIPRRVNHRKMNAHDIREATRSYETGDSLATIADNFSADAATVRRELRRAGVTMRPRRGWA